MYNCCSNSPSSWPGVIRHSVLLKEEGNAMSFHSLCLKLKVDGYSKGWRFPLPLFPVLSSVQSRKQNYGYQKWFMLQKFVVQTSPQSALLGIGDYTLEWLKPESKTMETLKYAHKYGLKTNSSTSKKPLNYSKQTWPLIHIKSKGGTLRKIVLIPIY